MPTIPPLPQAMIPVLPFVALIITDWLRHSTLPRWLNVLIALIVPLILATIWALLSNALTPDLSGDIALLVALCYAVMALPDIAPLRDWLQSTLVSPAAVFAQQQPAPEPEVASWSGPPVPYQSPQGINLQPVNQQQFYGNPVEAMRSQPMPTVQYTTQPMQSTIPETPAPAVPVEESPAK